jgi:hypothetical protein
MANILVDLANLCHFFHVEHEAVQKPHNAGNDAFLTVALLIAIAYFPYALARDLPGSPVHPFFGDCVILCLDCEWLGSRDGEVVTEIGLAALDTRDLKDHKPENWTRLIRTTHIIVRDFQTSSYKRLAENYPWSKHRPEEFLFGQSLRIYKRDVLDKVKDFFSFPGAPVLDDKIVQPR